MTEIEHQLRDFLADYLAGQRDIGELNRHIAVVIHSPALESSTRRLVSEVVHRVAEYTSGSWSEEALRELLRPLAQNYRTEWRPVQSARVPRTTNRPRHQWPEPRVHVKAAG